MKIDYQNRDSSSQIKNLQDLLGTDNPSKENLALAMVCIILIFYENRPGKLKDLHNYSIHGTGCHNPTSEKTGETIWNIWRYEITIKKDKGPMLVIKWEYKQGGYIKATFYHNNSEQTVTADIFGIAEIAEARSVGITCQNTKSIMDELNLFLKEPLDTLAAMILVKV